MIKAFKSKWIISASETENQIYENSTILVKNGIIIDIISNENIYEEIYDEIIDFGNAVITPGFINLSVNLHYSEIFNLENKGIFIFFKKIFLNIHKFFSMIGVPINTYTMKLTEAHKSYLTLSKKNKTKSFKLGLIKSILSGTTCLVHTSNEQQHFKFLNNLPLKTFFFIEINSDSSKNSKKQYLLLKKQIHNIAKRIKEDTFIGLFPYSIWSVHKKLLRLISKYSKINNTKILLPLLESEEELIWFNNKHSNLNYFNLFRGLKKIIIKNKYKSSIEYLNTLKLLNKNTIIRNGNYLTEKELQELSLTNTKLCISPKINKEIFNKSIKTDSLIRNFEKNFGLCTGNLHENKDLNMLKELFELNLNLPIEEIIKYITIYPSKILGVNDIIGSIEVGKHADFNVFNLNKKQSYNDLKEILKPSKVFIKGENIVDDGIINPNLI